MREAFGGLSTDWKEGINWPAVRQWRLTRAREAMARHGLGAMLLMYDENMRYVSSTYTPGWNRLKPGLRYVVLCEGREPIVYEQGDIGIHLKVHNPWIPPGNVRHSYSWIKGAAGPASQNQVRKFTEALVDDLEEAGVRDRPLGVDFIDLNMIAAFGQAGITWADGMTPMMEARAIKSPDEQKALRIVGAICDTLHYEFTQFLRPGLTENEVAAFGFASPVQHPRHGGRRGHHRVLRPERVAQLAQLLRPDHPPRRTGDHRPGRADLERVQVVRVPDVLRGRHADRRDEAVLRHRTQVAVGCDRGGPAGGDHRGTSRRSGRRRGRPGVTRRRTRPPRTCGGTGSGSPSTTGR